MEPVIIYTISGGNMFAVEPIRDRTEWIGRKHGVPLVGFKELHEFLGKHFKKVGDSLAV